jgi:hypothetical protein
LQRSGRDRERRDRERRPSSFRHVGIERRPASLELLRGQHVVVEQLRHDKHIPDVDDAALAAGRVPLRIVLQQALANGLWAQIGASAKAGARVRGHSQHDHTGALYELQCREEALGHVCIGQRLIVPPLQRLLSLPPRRHEIDAATCWPEQPGELFQSS